MKGEKTPSEMATSSNLICLDDGEIKTILRKDIQHLGWFTLEEAKELSRTRLKTAYKQMLKQSKEAN